jgi:glycosyltransferase involved in cell wall biosynthesis
MARSVSICVPTYNRPELVREAVESALNQTYADIEVVVSDDSPDDRTEHALTDLIGARQIRYVRNKAALRQARNVNQLFDLANGEFLVLLHDDDLLLPDAVSALVDCFVVDPAITAAFGKQYLIGRNGKADEAGSVSLNATYWRTPEFAGRQLGLRSVLVAQFPNDGYMVRAMTARQVRYRDVPSVGDACDFDFGLRLAATDTTFYFLDRYTAKYRITGESVGSGNNYANLTFDLLAALDLPADLAPARLQRLRAYAAPAVNKWLTLGEHHSALRVYRSRGYGWTRRLSLQGVVQAALLLCPPSLSRRIILAIRSLRRRR